LSACSPLQCPMFQQRATDWLPCRLCSKKGHCITSCPAFKPSLVQLVLQPRQKTPSAADFPRPVASAKPDAAALQRAASSTAASVTEQPAAQADATPAVAQSAADGAQWSIVARKTRGPSKPAAPQHMVAAKKPVPSSAAPAATPSVARSDSDMLHALLRSVQQLISKVAMLEGQLADVRKAQDSALNGLDDYGLEEGEVMEEDN
jgi:hypothetical protein